jgi:hypothetical protein
MLVPFGHLLSLGISSAGEYRGNYAPVGMFMVLLPYVWPSLMNFLWIRGYLLTIYAGMAISGLLCKVNVPVGWQHYVSSPMFAGREFIWNPAYGYMIVDGRISKFFDKVCDKIYSSRVQSLFSTPYSYANYYCGVPSWHNYILTFFDTTNAKTMISVNTEIREAPPAWIVYQWQPKNFRQHEIVYNHGQRLPQRDMEEYIFGQIARGNWRVVLYKHMFADDYWFLIRTAPNVESASDAGPLTHLVEQSTIATSSQLPPRISSINSRTAP